jgi:hypothetical protein
MIFQLCSFGSKSNCKVRKSCVTIPLRFCALFLYYKVIFLLNEAVYITVNQRYVYKLRGGGGVGNQLSRGWSMSSSCGAVPLYRVFIGEKAQECKFV